MTNTKNLIANANHVTDAEVQAVHAAGLIVVHKPYEAEREEEIREKYRNRDDDTKTFFDSLD